VHSVLHKLGLIITCSIIDAIFYAMHVLTIIITCTFLAELEVQEKKLGSHTRTGVMEDAKEYYSCEEEIIHLHVSMGNVEIDSNGRRGKNMLVTMRRLHRRVQSHMADNERIMKAQEEILPILNVLRKQFNKDFGTNQEASAGQVTTSRSHRKMDDHGNDMKSRSMNMHHHSPRKSNRRNHVSSGP